VVELSDFDRGFLIGLLAGEGSFGGDGRQPQVVLRMHVRHEAVFRWLERTFPNCRLYGPYHHSGRSYYQWMARGRALVADLLPLLEAELVPERDGHSAERLRLMLERYAPFIERERARIGALREAAPHRPATGAGVAARHADAPHAPEPPRRADAPHAPEPARRAEAAPPAGAMRRAGETP